MHGGILYVGGGVSYDLYLVVLSYILTVFLFQSFFCFSFFYHPLSFFCRCTVIHCYVLSFFCRCVVIHCYCQLFFCCPIVAYCRVFVVLLSLCCYSLLYIRSFFLSFFMIIRRLLLISF